VTLRRRGTPSHESLYLDAYAHAVKEMASSGTPMDGGCIEASVLMHKYLREHGKRAELVRRDLGSDEGHWTIRTSDGEFDPTINFWNGGRGGLRIVRKSDPHRQWPETTADERGAYSTVFGRHG